MHHSISVLINDPDFFNTNLRQEISQVFQIHEILHYEDINISKINRKLKWTGLYKKDPLDIKMPELFLKFVDILNSDIDMVLEPKKSNKDKEPKKSKNKGSLSITKAFKKLSIQKKK